MVQKSQKSLHKYGDEIMHTGPEAGLVPRTKAERTLLYAYVCSLSDQRACATRKQNFESCECYCNVITLLVNRVRVGLLDGVDRRHGRIIDHGTKSSGIRMIRR